jgi:hypothetical protein
LEISEKVIEDIFCVDKSILPEILNIPYSEISLLARQKVLNSGVLDLLYMWKDELLLIELKAVPFYKDIVDQINDYYEDLVKLQSEGKLIKARIKKVILVTSASNIQIEECLENDISLIVYQPDYVLLLYYENFRELSQFLTIQSGDFGVVRLGLIHSALKSIADGKNLSQTAQILKRSVKTLKNRLSVADQLGLIGKFKSDYFLTELGEKFTNSNDSIDDRLNSVQIEILQNILIENPFFSSITYTIFSIIESVFILSKNSYPVTVEALKDYFVKSVGKSKTWNAEKSKDTATYIFSNYAIELEFLAKVNNEYFITPLGIRAVLILQLNRSLKLIGSKRT